MKKLTDEEVDEIINLAYTTSANYILNYMNKKDFEDIDITINLDTGDDSFDIDIDINLDTDAPLPNNLAENAIDASIHAVDEYIEKRNSNL